MLADELPNLPPLVAYTPSCGSFQPWKEDSIAISFTDHGAAAYAGHMHSPSINGFLMRRGRAVPGMYTWPEFPLGVLVQVQNRMTMRVTFNTPLFYLLGDPRLHQMAEAPYQVISDETGEDGVRTLHGKSSMSGLPTGENRWRGSVPLREHSRSGCRRRIGPVFQQPTCTRWNLGSDKYLLFYHPGGEFEIELTPQVPPLWLCGRHPAGCAGLFLGGIGAGLQPVLAGLASCVGGNPVRQGPRRQHILLRRLQQGIPDRAGTGRRETGLPAGCACTAIRCTPVWPNTPRFDLVLGFGGSFSAAAGGLILILTAKNNDSARIAGFALAVLPQLALTVFVPCYG